MTKIVNGASRQPYSGGAPPQLVLLLHGFGSSGSDLIAFVPHWQQALPDALFLAPHAPQRPGFGQGYQWWPLTAVTPQALATGPAARSSDRRTHRPQANLAIVGFSQGTMMALHVGLRRKTAVAGIVGYSGMLTGGHDLARQVVTKPPVLLVQGSADLIVPVGALHEAEAHLRGVGVEGSTHVFAGLGHTVDPAGLRLGGEFAARVLAG